MSCGYGCSELPLRPRDRDKQRRRLAVGDSQLPVVTIIQLAAPKPQVASRRPGEQAVCVSMTSEAGSQATQQAVKPTASQQARDRGQSCPVCLSSMQLWLLSLAGWLMMMMSNSGPGRALVLELVPLCLCFSSGSCPFAECSMALGAEPQPCAYACARACQPLPAQSHHHSRLSARA